MCTDAWTYAGDVNDLADLFDLTELACLARLGAGAAAAHDRADELLPDPGVPLIDQPAGPSGWPPCPRCDGERRELLAGDRYRPCPYCGGWPTG